MTAQQAREILKYSIVIRNGDPNCKGTVTGVGYTSFFVQWENGAREQVGFHDAQHVDLWQPQERQP